MASLTGSGKSAAAGRTNAKSDDYDRCSASGMNEIEMEKLTPGVEEKGVVACQVVVTCDTDDEEETADSSLDYSSYSTCRAHCDHPAVADNYHSSAVNPGKGHPRLSQMPLSSVIRSGSGGVKAVRFVERSADKTQTALVARRKVIRLLIAVVLTFAICVLPSHVYQLWTLFGDVGYSPSTFHKILPAVTYLILYTNSALNPILYAFLSDNFRKSLKELLGGFKKKSNAKRNTMRSTVSMKTANTMI